jgi:hypothetical protein
MIMNDHKLVPQFGILLFAIISLLFSCSCEKTTTEPPAESKGMAYGTVTSEVLQQPIEGAVVQALKNQAMDTTDSMGSFRLNSLTLGPDTLKVTAKYYETSFKVIQVTTDSQQVTFALNAGSDLGCIPVEDTGRVYVSPFSGMPIEIYPKAVFARFYPWVTDTNQIKPVLDQYNLKTVLGSFLGLDNQWAAYLCINDNRRAECHFTPYGKTGFDNFGANPLVEYAFAVFTEGSFGPVGNISFLFIDGTHQSTIDSLFNANGLRFLRTIPHPSGRLLYITMITPQAPMNILDLSEDLKSLPYVELLDVNAFINGIPNRCD